MQLVHFDHGHTMSGQCADCAATMEQHRPGYALDHEPMLDGEDDAGYELCVCGERMRNLSDDVGEGAPHGVAVTDHPFETWCTACGYSDCVPDDLPDPYDGLDEGEVRELERDKLGAFKDYLDPNAQRTWVEREPKATGPRRW